MEWEEYHQKEELTTRLRNILEEYPTGIGPFKEFLQNADDATARDFSIFFDKFSHETKSLLTKELAAWQGAALFMYNSANFKEEDFKSIVSVGQSGKFRDENKIGKYGLGFNVSYHFTDVISFISGDQLIFFDPHGLYLPNNIRGLRMNFVKSRLAENSDQLKPFQSMFPKHNFLEPFEGTVFRLPLRNPAQAESSKISSCHFNENDIMGLLSEFTKVASSTLLFLKNLENISIFVKTELSAEPKLIQQINIANASEELRIIRGTVDVFDRVDYSLEIANKSDNEHISQEKWLIRAGKDERRQDLAKKLHQKSVASIAVLLTEENNTVTPQFVGQVYCYLPVIQSNLNVHIHAPFSLSSNRRELWRAEGEYEGISALKSVWNDFLLFDFIPILYAELLQILADIYSQDDAIYKYWPVSDTVRSPYNKLQKVTLEKIIENDYRLLWSDIDQCFYKSSEILMVEPLLVKDYQLTLNALGKCQIKLINLPEHIRKEFEGMKVQLPTTSHEVVSNILRENKNTLDLELSEAENIFKFLTSDWDINHFSQFPWQRLFGLKILPLANEEIGLIESHDNAFCPTYIVCKSKYIPMLPRYKFFVHESVGSLPIFSNKQYYLKTANIQPLTTQIIASAMSLLLPPSFRAVESVGNKKSEVTKGNEYDLKNTVFVGDRDIKKETQTLSKWMKQAEPAPAPPANGKKARKEKKGKKGKKGKDLKTEEPQQPVAQSQPTVLDNTIPEINFPEIIQRITLLWKFFTVENNIIQILNIGNTWPIVPTNTGGLVTITYAKKRFILSPGDFSEDIVSLLEDFGCLFVEIAPKLLPFVSGALRIAKEQVIKSLTSSFEEGTTSEKITFEHSRKLRNLILQWSQTSEITITAAIKQLPIFNSLTRKKFLTLSPALAYAAPATSGRQTFDPISKWDSLLIDLFGDELLSLAGSKERRLLELVNNPRPLIFTFFENFLPDKFETVSQELSVCVLETIHSMKFGNIAGSRLMQSLELSKIIVADDGSRKPASHFYDSSDPVFLQIFGKDDQAITYLPEVYCTPSILSVLRKIGLQTLSNPVCFCNAARKIHNTKDMEKAGLLTKYFLENYKTFTNWVQSDYINISTLHFLVGYNYSEFNFPPIDMVGPINLPFIHSLNTNTKPPAITMFRNSGIKKKDAWNSVHRSAAKAVNRLQANIEGDRSSPDAVKKPKKVLTSFSESQLSAFAWYTWSSSPILPIAFNGLPHSMIHDLRVETVFQAKQLLENFTKMVRVWQNSRLPLQFAPLQKEITRLMFSAFLDSNTQRNTHQHLATNLLKPLPYVILENGSFVSASTIYLDLQDDQIGTFFRAPPAYLEDFYDILVWSGAHETRLVDTITIHTKNNANAEILVPKIVESFNNPALCDVVFVIQDPEAGREDLLYASSLLLLLSGGETWAALFSVSNTVKFRNGRHREITVPEWFTYASLEIYLRYCYTGEIRKQSTNPLDAELHPSNANDVEIICSLLRIADYYLVDYVKQWCEVFLSDPSIVTVLNVCDLLTHADACSAGQLLAVFTTFIKNYFEVISQTDSFKNLPPHLLAKFKKI